MFYNFLVLFQNKKPVQTTVPPTHANVPIPSEATAPIIALINIFVSFQLDEN